MPGQWSILGNARAVFVASRLIAERMSFSVSPEPDNYYEFTVAEPNRNFLIGVMLRCYAEMPVKAEETE